jgi:hypothetical protein
MCPTARHADRSLTTKTTRLCSSNNTFNGLTTAFEGVFLAAHILPGGIFQADSGQNSFYCI